MKTWFIVGAFRDNETGVVYPMQPIIIVTNREDADAHCERINNIPQREEARVAGKYTESKLVVVEFEFTEK